MTVVSNTSPLNYLVLCQAVEILPRLFERVVVPPTVLKELQSDDAPDAVRAWAEQLPSWVIVQTPVQRDLSLKVHPGERDAICLATEIHAELILLDDRAARAAASDRGLAVVGTLGLLERAAAMCLLDLPAAVNALAATNFKIVPALVEHALDRDAERRAQRTCYDERRTRE